MTAQLNLHPTRDPIKFLGLLKHIADRVEAGGTHAISLQECQSWGYERKEALLYLLSLIDVGVLNTKITVFDDDEDMFVDFYGEESELQSYPEDKVKIWFRPSLTKEELSPFFAVAPVNLWKKLGRKTKLSRLMDMQLTRN